MFLSRSLHVIPGYDAIIAVAISWKLRAGAGGGGAVSAVAQPGRNTHINAAEIASFPAFIVFPRVTPNWPRCGFGYGNREQIVTAQRKPKSQG